MHIPVLTESVLNALDPHGEGLYLDGTVGLGGHAKMILEAGVGCSLCGLDRDAKALEMAKENLVSFGDRVHLYNANYSNFDFILHNLGWSKIDGALLDLGISSFQIDTAQRGFSFRNDGPLDMRMNPDGQSESAWHFVNKSGFEVLKECIATLGEEPLAGRIAREIVSAREVEPINSTVQLSGIILKAYPPAWKRKARKHPATRTFQAIRMAVNNELQELEIFLEKILAWLNPGGRLAIISFHSLEDRLVKHAMRRWASACICPPYARGCTCCHKPEVKIIFKKPVEASHAELLVNPRAASAKLRAVEKLSVKEI